ncbi:MAG: MBL fold metallo-hydrolase [Butyrivibrio sp.]|nr:MBL fold metallo-hydrolase [Butyrivibrio sp.]
MKIIQLLEGKPFMTEFGIVGYSTVVLIRVNNKNILYDTGNKSTALQLKDALDKNGLVCDDITDVVLSHLHFDHVGNVPLFKNANFYLSKKEWLCAESNPDEWDCLATCEYLRRNGNLNFVKEGDMIEEGVLVIDLPGHTPGLIGLKCGEDTVLCSDAIKNRFELWQDIPLMSVDVEKSKSTIERIKSEGKYIYPGHDKMLDIDNPICDEAIHFIIKYANGMEQKI